MECDPDNKLHRKVNEVLAEIERLRDWNTALIQNEARFRRIEEAAKYAYTWLTRPRTERAVSPAEEENARLDVQRKLRAALAVQPTEEEVNDIVAEVRKDYREALDKLADQ